MHEDMPTGLRAKHTLDHLADEPGTQLHFVVKLWTFKMLRDPLLREYAVSDAHAAHILFLSLHGHLELPNALHDLIEHWIATRERRPIALVVSLDESLRESPVANATLEHLRTKAAAGGVDLFPHFGATPATAWHWASRGVPKENRVRQTVRTPFLRETMGLNEQPSMSAHKKQGAKFSCSEGPGANTEAVTTQGPPWPE